MQLFLIEARRKRFILLAQFVLLPLLLFVFGALRPAASDSDIKNLLICLESLYPFLAAFALCHTLFNRYECLSVALRGEKAARVAGYDLALLYSVPLASGLAFGCFLLPGWTLARFALSYPVTLLFFCALALLLRFAINVRYANHAAYAGAFALFTAASAIAPDAAVTRAVPWRDVFVNATYHLTFSDGAGYWYVTPGIFAANRAIFLFAAAAMVAAALVCSNRRSIYKPE